MKLLSYLVYTLKILLHRYRKISFQCIYIIYLKYLINSIQPITMNNGTIRNMAMSADINILVVFRNHVHIKEWPKLRLELMTTLSKSVQCWNPPNRTSLE